MVEGLMVNLAYASSPEIDGLDALVVPLGSVEQHGPHLPLGTDTIIASHVAALLTPRLSGAALAPAIPIGSSGEHAGFPGTLSIGTEALTLLLVELVRDADRDYRRVIVVNGHGGNGPAIAAAQAICEDEGRALICAPCHFPGADAHAGETETSVMLHIAPDLVRRDLAAPGNLTPVAELLPQMRAGGVRAVAANGVLGDPTRATPQRGADLVAELVDRLALQLAR